jgi:beta-lactamase class A
MPKNLRVKKQTLLEVVLCLTLFFPLMGDTQPLRAASPVSASTPTPLEINPDDWQSFAGAIRQRARRYGGTVGYIVKDMHSGRIVSSNDSKVFLSASLIKLPILVATFQAVDDGLVTLNQTFTLRREDKKGGSGVLKYAAPGTVLTLRELLEYMIIQSDNTAAELIIQQLGFDYLRATFRRLGLQRTEIHPEGFNLTGRRVSEDNKTTASDMAFLLEKIYTRELVSPEASDEMLVILKHQKLRDRLPRYLPTGWEIAHKTGLLRRACHDVGIVFSPSGDYLICVMTSNHSTYKNAKRLIASLGRITFDYYQSGFHRPMEQSRHNSAGSDRAS